MTTTPQKYCDLVMKGGVTSGIVYPNAVLELSKEYRFKSIGGTSAGAIAAAVTAAAAVGDRNKYGNKPTGKGSGFAGLQVAAVNLASEGFIYRLFQPAGGARNAYRLVVLLAGKASVWRKLLGAVVAVFAIAPLEILIALAIFCGAGYLISGETGAKGASVPALFLAFGLGAGAAALRTARVARRNLMGLCSGLRSTGWFRRKDQPALTEWLHTVIQDLSGKEEGSGPLTFADLSDAPAYADEPATKHSIKLQIITTCVSHHEPHTLPFQKKAFWFLEGEFKRLFPKEVVDWMIENGGDIPIVVGLKTYHRLPPADQLPVLVAARMSLSFPLLISAVPLYEPAQWDRRTDEMPDAEAAEAAREPGGSRELAPGAGVARSMEGLTSGGEAQSSADGVAEFRVCWFSDGGISSNFPIHLFDSTLPRWPTFAINLVYPRADSRQSSREERESEGNLEGSVTLPKHNNQGWKYTYHSIANRYAIREVSSFMFGIIGTMQNWRDLLQSRAPGHRDRIAEIALKGTEGGMNLNMPKEDLQRISRKGTIAGQRFSEFSFENHYWIRWRNVSAAVQRYTMEFAMNTDSSMMVPAYDQAYALPTGSTTPPSYIFGKRAELEAQALYSKMRVVGLQWRAGPDLSQGAPNPRPELRITPTY